MFYSLFGMLEMASGIGILKKGVGSRAQFKWKHKNVVFDNSKAKADLNWSFKVPLSDGMTKTFEWYNQHCR
jgi:nucleoside-diphosphate-sugar epimerase